ncbi:hypothetical protein AVEN_238698-1 [Araneus ventricosus]|uniref:Uncharacterized protein n=1 Tax=Araneus ventricosus TaxID=182803 RepID=A0A4Y2BXP2_ARAVE|nr:hypothetical protein AVEN_238698-1 [Araneus ventricosus]
MEISTTPRCNLSDEYSFVEEDKVITESFSRVENPPFPRLLPPLKYWTRRSVIERADPLLVNQMGTSTFRSMKDDYVDGRKEKNIVIITVAFMTFGPRCVIYNRVALLSLGIPRFRISSTGTPTFNLGLSEGAPGNSKLLKRSTKYDVPCYCPLPYLQMDIL